MRIRRLDRLREREKDEGRWKRRGNAYVRRERDSKELAEKATRTRPQLTCPRVCGCGREGEREGKREGERNDDVLDKTKNSISADVLPTP